MSIRCVQVTFLLLLLLFIYLVSAVLLLLGTYIMLVLCQLLNAIKVLFFVSVDIAFFFIS